jgi:hypothetical protein
MHSDTHNTSWLCIVSKLRWLCHNQSDTKLATKEIPFKWKNTGFHHHQKYKVDEKDWTSTLEWQTCYISRNEPGNDYRLRELRRGVVGRREEIKRAWHLIHIYTRENKKHDESRSPKDTKAYTYFSAPFKYCPRPENKNDCRKQINLGTWARP